MKTFIQFQEEIKNVPSVRELGGLSGGGGGTNAITGKAKGKTLKNRIKDVGKILTFPFHKRRKDPTEKFATEEVDFVQYIKDRFKEKGLSGFVRPKKVEKKKKTIGDLLKNLNTNTNEEMMVAPTNNVGGGKIAGTVEAGDNPPVKKKKKTYAYGGRGSRKMWMNNK